MQRNKNATFYSKMAGLYFWNIYVMLPLERSIQRLLFEKDFYFSWNHERALWKCLFALYINLFCKKNLLRHNVINASVCSSVYLGGIVPCLLLLLVLPQFLLKWPNNYSLISKNAPFSLSFGNPLIALSGTVNFFDQNQTQLIWKRTNFWLVKIQ